MEEVNKIIISEAKDGVVTRSTSPPSPSVVEQAKLKIEECSKKRRRGKSKRKISKPFSKVPWVKRRQNEKSKRNNRFRKIVLTKTHAPYNNNQFLMEIHKPEPENDFQILQTPSARTRDSSFSVDSDENYFYSLPDDEEEFLTKEFSSVYEDAQSERLSAMTKSELIQEYVLLEAKYESLVKRTKFKAKNDDEKDCTRMENDSTTTDKESSDRDTTGTSADLSITEEPVIQEVIQRVKDQEEQIRELKLANEKLRLQNEHLSQRSGRSSTEDSESDSGSTSVSCSSSDSSRCASPAPQTNNESNNAPLQENGIHSSEDDNNTEASFVNGVYNESTTPAADEGQME